MQQAIVIATTPSTNPFLQNLLYSINGYDKYPIIILSDYNYELGKIKFMVEHIDFDEFLLLHDTCEIKDTSLFDIVFKLMSGKSVSLSTSPSPCGSYLGKYRREVLEKMTIPKISSKLETVDQEEIFNRSYPDEWHYLKPTLKNSNIFVNKFGKDVMVLENKYLIKYKSTWTRSQIKPS
ncbi:MAG: hypothetical protein K0U38_01520 [Epsilonproteobacteria bacterium]|nr:hypothetical protein [Campylobacterota bacterium]